MRCYSQCIDEQVGKEHNGPLGPEIKAMNLPKPEKYMGKDDINKFNKWLVQLTLQLGCVGSHLCITHRANAQIWIGAFDTQLYFDIANIDHYDYILGILFLWQNAVIVDFGWQVLRIRRGMSP